MSIQGVSFVQKGNCNLCLINDFSPELKDLIRQDLVAITRGCFASKDDSFFSYKNTVKEFLNRYLPKDEKKKKGMMGELLAHVLLSTFIENLRSLSILFNKEDRQVKKGFDVIFFDKSQNKLWYSEVKSGSKNKPISSNRANTKLLKDAKEDILQTKLKDVRDSVWHSAKIDASQVLDKTYSQGEIVQKILSADFEDLQQKKQAKKNVILISVLYEPLDDPIKQESLNDFFQSINAPLPFNELIVFSVQKDTYHKIASFLEAEAAHA
jgi:hypothetical protein